MDEPITSEQQTEEIQDSQNENANDGTQSEGSTSEVVQISRADLDSAIADAATAAAADVSIATLDAIGEVAGAEGTVLIADTQWQTITQMDATQLQTSIVTAGLIALLLGAVVGIGMTLHWRGSRG